MIGMTFPARIAPPNSELHSVHRTTAAPVFNFPVYTSHRGRALEALNPKPYSSILQLNPYRTSYELLNPSWLH